MESGTSNAYGASLAGGSFDLVKFVQQPHTVVRALSWIFAIVVFASITAEGYINPTLTDPTPKCMFNQNDSACHYAVGIAVLAFLACLVFLALDAYFPQISNASQRKYIVTGDLVFSGIWTFLWFVCFCLLANQWSYTQNAQLIPGDAARAVIAFSFFSIASWTLLTFFAYKRYRQGVEDFSQNHLGIADDHATSYPTSYSPYSVEGSESYQQPPFSNNAADKGEGSYQPPTY